MLHIAPHTFTTMSAALRWHGGAHRGLGRTVEEALAKLIVAAGGPANTAHTAADVLPIKAATKPDAHGVLR